MLGWIGEVEAFASIGFSVLGNVEEFRNFENYGLSRVPQVGMVACSNVQYNRPWTNLIYKIGIVTNQEQTRRSECLNRLAEDQQRLALPDGVQDPFFLSFNLGLTDCPCSYFQAIRDFRFFRFSTDNEIPGENICFYSRFLRLFVRFFAYRCCYDRDR